MFPKKKELEKKKKQREMIQELRRNAAKARRGRGGRGGAWSGGGGGGYGPNYNPNVGNFEEDGGGWGGPGMMHVNEMRRHEPLDRGHMDQMRQKSVVRREREVARWRWAGEGNGVDRKE